MLYEFTAEHRFEIIRQCKLKVISRPVGAVIAAGIDHGLLPLLDQLVATLELGFAARKGRIHAIVNPRKGEMPTQGFTVPQAMLEDGGVGQAITELGIKSRAPFGTNAPRVLDGCLGAAIANSVTELGRERTLPASAAAGGDGEPLKFLAHELRGLINTATLAFEVLKAGPGGNGGSAGRIIDRTLWRLRDLISLSLTDVLLQEGTVHLEEIHVGAFLKDLVESASLDAIARGVKLAFNSRAAGVIEADRQLLATAVMNLLQNALKFTRLGTTVTLSVRTQSNRVLIEVRDQCGGIPSGNVERFFRPLVQPSANREGLGLTLTKKAMEAMGGGISVRNTLAGCAFTVDLPRVRRPGSTGGFLGGPARKRRLRSRGAIQLLHS